MTNNKNVRTSFRIAEYPSFLLEKMKKLTGKSYKDLFDEMFRNNLRNIVTNEDICGFDSSEAQWLSLDSADSFLGAEGQRKTFVISKDTHHAIKQLSKSSDYSVDHVVNGQIMVLAYANDLAVLKIHERRVARFDVYSEILTKLQEMLLEIGTQGILGGPDDEHWFHGKDYDILYEVENMLDSLERTVTCRNDKLIDFDYSFGRTKQNSTT